MRLFAALLIVLGVVAIARGGFTYRTRETLIDAGSVEVTTEKTNRVHLPPAFGAVTIAAGVVVLVLDRKR